MKETARDLPKKHPLRNKIAEQLRSALKKEETPITGLSQIAFGKRGPEYALGLYGIQKLFNYIRTLPSTTVLDIGAGNTAGVNELSKSPFGQGLKFEATVLKHDPQIKTHLGEHKTHITSAEILGNIPNGSIGGIISVMGTTYSMAQSLMAGNLDRVLVPGGVVKFCYFAETRVLINGQHVESSRYLRRTLGELRYAVAAVPGGWLVLAIKPGNLSAPKAETLLKQDFNSVQQQIATLQNLT